MSRSPTAIEIEVPLIFQAAIDQTFKIHYLFLTDFSLRICMSNLGIYTVTTSIKIMKKNISLFLMNPMRT